MRRRMPVDPNLLDGGRARASAPNAGTDRVLVVNAPLGRLDFMMSNFCIFHRAASDVWDM